MENNERTNFDNLVSQMSSEERKELLAKMRPFEADPEINSLQSVKNPSMLAEDVKIDEGLRRESLLYRIILWLRAIFSSTTVEQLYNDDKIMTLYRKINQEYPGLLDYKGKLLLGIFYEKLVDLKRAADFFRPYLDEIYKNIGAFYVYLGSFLAPKVTEDMNNDVDPNNLGLEREVTIELRTSFLRKMDDIIKGIPSDQRVALYNCASSVEWLYQFSRLPFERFISSFSSGITDSQVARFETVSSELNSFAKILCNGKTVPSEALESIYLYSAKRIVTMDSVATDDESRAKEFMDKASSCMTIIHMFVTTVPLRYVNKIIYGNIQWTCEQFAGAEDWFLKYKEHWKKLFDDQWDQWLKAKRKSEMNSQLKANFGIDEIPLFPHRPWADMWGGIAFHFENTAGFLYWFTANKMHSSSEPLKTLLLEGQFVNDENRQEFADTLNTLDYVSTSMYNMAQNISPSGQTGMVFEKLSADRMRTIPAQQRIDSLMLEHETNIQKIKDDFCKCARSIRNILGGVFSEIKDTRYDGIQNLASIQGNNNANFRAKLMESKSVFDSALEILKELERIDSPPKKQ